MTRPRVFLDANVLFSASNSASTFARLLAWAAEHSTLVSSDLARLEAERNLSLKRPVWLPEFESLIPEIEWVSTATFDLPVELADKDVPILCAAIRERCDFFVTGDRRDFGQLFGETVLGTRVIPPSDLIAALSQGA